MLEVVSFILGLTSDLTSQGSFVFPSFWASICHLDIDVWPVNPGTNWSSTEVAWMLVMAKFRGASGSSTMEIEISFNPQFYTCM